MEHLWWLFAFAAGFTTSLYLSFNQYVKMPPALLMVYRGLLLSLFLLPFLFYFKPVPNMLFYILCVVQGSLVAYMDNRFFAISRQYGAEVSGTIQPFSLMPVFMIWLTVTPDQAVFFVHHPLSLVFIILALVGMSYAALMLCRAENMRYIIKKTWPLVIGVAVIDVLNKKIMNESSGMIVSALYYYMLIVSFTAGMANLSFLLIKRQRLSALFDKRNLCCGIVVVLIILASMLLKNYAMYLSFNPAYASAAILTAPLWVMLMNYFLLHDEADIIRLKWQPVVLLVAAAGVLIVATGKI